jgi:hypothetical protein
MWQKFKEQIPAVILTAALIIGAAFWLSQKTLDEAKASQDAKLAQQRSEFEAQIKASSEQTRQQIQSVDKLLKDAIQKREADVFMTGEEVAKLNAEKVNQLAEAIAKKVQPYNPLPKSPEEAERMQNEQVDKVSTRMADKISPILAEMAKDQNLTRESINAYSEKIADQIGRVLTSEMAKNQQLNNNLMATQAVAQDAMKLSHEITALYLSSIKDNGAITRLLSLPANLVKDVANKSIVSNSERKAIEQDLINRMNETDKRLADIQAQNPKK